MQGGKFKLFPSVNLKENVNPGIAKVAHAVEEDDIVWHGFKIVGRHWSFSSLRRARNGQGGVSSKCLPFVVDVWNL